MVTTRYAVQGMTCGHCVSAVTSEVGRIAGVTGVEVDLATGSVTVTSEAALDPAAVREAVDEAGYDVI
jgi:copper chaperone